MQCVRYRSVDRQAGTAQRRLGSTPYEDPQLQITVDNNNAIAESDESNNRLRR